MFDLARTEICFDMRQFLVGDTQYNPDCGVCNKAIKITTLHPLEGQGKMYCCNNLRSPIVLAWLLIVGSFWIVPSKTFAHRSSDPNDDTQINQMSVCYNKTPWACMEGIFYTFLMANTEEIYQCEKSVFCFGILPLLGISKNTRVHRPVHNVFNDLLTWITLDIKSLSVLYCLNFHFHSQLENILWTLSGLR